MDDETNTLISDDVKARFWGKVSRKTDHECWLWTAATGRGYGQFWHLGRRRKATHISIEMTTGKPFPSGMVACHKCDNPGCVNPSHLFVGTMRDNTLDAIAKGRLTTKAMHAKNHNLHKAECKRGHPFDAVNSYTTYRGERACRECLKIHRDNYIARNGRLSRSKAALAERRARTALGAKP